MGKEIISLEGQKFDKLFVDHLDHIENQRRYWYCICDCNGEDNIRIISTDVLKSGRSRSCGCTKSKRISESKFIDLIGKRYGRLIVLSENGVVDNSRNWNCKCDCGNDKIVSTRDLQSGHVQSCGCYAIDCNRIGFGEASFNSLIIAYRGRAEKRNFSFNLGREEFRNITKQNCYYCNCEPSNIIHARGCNGDYIYNGIDRVDNSRGYEIDNVVPCCTTCNKAKLTMSTDEFTSWIKRVYNHLNL